VSGNGSVWHWRGHFCGIPNHRTDEPTSAMDPGRKLMDQPFRQWPLPDGDRDYAPCDDGDARRHHPCHGARPHRGIRMSRRAVRARGLYAQLWKGSQITLTLFYAAKINTLNQASFSPLESLTKHVTTRKSLDSCDHRSPRPNS